MNIKCPHCGTEYEIEKHEFGKFVTCHVCDKNFVAGVKQQGKSASPRSEPHDHQTSRQGGPLAGEFKSSDGNTRTVAEQYSDGDTKFITPSVRFCRLPHVFARRVRLARTTFVREVPMRRLRGRWRMSRAAIAPSSTITALPNRTLTRRAEYAI